MAEMVSVITAFTEFSASAGLDREVAEAGELVLDELLNNIITHAYLDAEQHKIVVEMCVVKDAMQIVVSDDGIPFNPFEQEDPDLKSPLEQREVGGMGVYLVKQFMDEYSYQRLEERNIVTLVKYLAAS